VGVDPLKLVPDGSVELSGSLFDDLKSQDENNVLKLEDNVPAYILARDDQSGWLAIYYMPEYNVVQFNRVTRLPLRASIAIDAKRRWFTPPPATP
jgi:twinfilin-like protein